MIGVRRHTIVAHAETLAILVEREAAEAFLIELDQHSNRVAYRTVVAISLHCVLLAFGSMQFFVVCADPAVHIVKLYECLWPLLGADASEDVLLRMIQVKLDLPIVPA